MFVPRAQGLFEAFLVIDIQYASAKMTVNTILVGNDAASCSNPAAPLWHLPDTLLNIQLAPGCDRALNGFVCPDSASGLKQGKKELIADGIGLGYAKEPARWAGLKQRARLEIDILHADSRLVHSVLQVLVTE